MTTKQKIKWVIFLLTLPFIGLLLWVLLLDIQLKKQIMGPWFLPPVEIYSRSEPIFLEQTIQFKSFKKTLLSMGFRLRTPHQKLHTLDFSIWDVDTCQQHINQPLPESTSACLPFIIKIGRDSKALGQLSLIVLDSQDKVLKLFQGQPLAEISQLKLPPQLFAQFYQKKPILRKIRKLSDIPLTCLQSVTAIEDSHFLTHKGVSPLGIARALLRNLRHGAYRQGGSTITQQLVKNYFLTPERSLRRKFKELFIALLLEARLTKDEILEKYLNVIYMGQNGPFQVMGFEAASSHYFSKPLEGLNSSECALLAAIINSPGRFNPFRHPDRAKKRRDLVLQKMMELNMLGEEDYQEALAQKLPRQKPKRLSEPAPYYIQAIQRKVRELGLSEEDGLKIYTALSEPAQESAQKGISWGLKRLEKKNSRIKKLKEDSNKHLEALLMSVDLQSGAIIALVGGRKFKYTQFNRALDGHRQVGSIMKPFIYLSALETTNSKGESYHPLSLLMDTPFTHKYEGQTWSPKNYGNKYKGPIPLFYGLKNSVNVVTAKLGLEIGLDSVIDLSRRLGVTSPIQPLPSLTLGAFELYPKEVLQSYTHIARMGESVPNYVIESIENLDGEILYERPPPPESEWLVAPGTAATLVGMLKQTLLTGTGRSIPLWRGFKHPAAGKTGTTSDTKDAWFVAFTPYILTLVWVGYDDNTAHGLTGSSGAIPIWAYYMNRFASRYPPVDFPWPEGTAIYELPGDQLNEMLPLDPHEKEANVELIFRNENIPDDFEDLSQDYVQRRAMEDMKINEAKEESGNE